MEVDKRSFNLFFSNISVFPHLPFPNRIHEGGEENLELLREIKVFIIVIKPGPGIDPVKGQDPGFHGSTGKN